MRFYVEYDIDAGQMMSVCDVFHAKDEAEARREWVNRVRGYVAYPEQGPDVFFAVSDQFDGAPDGVVLSILKEKNWRAHYRALRPSMPEQIVTLGRAIKAMLGMGD